MRTAGAALIVLILVVIVIIVARENRPMQFPMVQAAAPSCPRLANPCDRVNCNKPDTRRIA